MSTQSEIQAYVTERVPQDWFAAVAVTVDREEAVVVGTLPGPSSDDVAARARIAGFRERTRAERMAIADDVQSAFGRKVAWGVADGATELLFTHLAVPVMTRLRQPERQVLDTLVAGGVARSRADALAWCVRLVGRNSEEWLSGLREALADVDRVRETGPQAG
jgi:hypothetical protein